MKMIDDSRRENASNSHFDHAQFRLAWLQYGRPDLFEKRLIAADGMPFIDRVSPRWAARLGEAQSAAIDGDFDAAIEAATAGISQIPAQFIDEVEKQIASYRQQKLYRLDADSKFHLDALSLPKYFPFFEELMSEGWKRVYR